MYSVYNAHVNNRNNLPSDHVRNIPGKRLDKLGFVNFVRFYNKKLNEQQATDIFMNLTKKLTTTLIGSKAGLDLGLKQQNTNSPLGKNKDIHDQLNQTN